MGCTLGVAWACLGTYLGSLAYVRTPHGAMAIRAVFIMIASFVHGYIRISTPRLFILVLLMLIPTLIGLVSTFHFEPEKFKLNRICRHHQHHN